MKTVQKQALRSVQNARVFETGSGFDVTVGIEARIGNDNRERYWQAFDVDQATGEIDIPERNLWGDVPSKTQAQKPEISDTKVTAFRMTILCAAATDHLVLVTQRPQNQEYTLVDYQNLGNLRKYELPLVSVCFASRSEEEQAVESAGPLAVRTANNRDRGKGSNRVDVWIVNKMGQITLIQLIVFSRDNGKSFQLVGTRQWEGSVRRLQKATLYPPEANEEVFKDPAIAKFVRPLIFEPKPAFPGFDVRAQVLEIPSFRDFVSKNIENCQFYVGDERNFPATRTNQFNVSGNGAVVKFFGHDLACGGYGIAEQTLPDETVQTFQFRYGTIDPVCWIEGVKSSIADEQGLYDIRRGDILEFAGTLDMGKDSTGKRYPRLLLGARVAYQTQS